MKLDSYPEACLYIELKLHAEWGFARFNEGPAADLNTEGRVVEMDIQHARH